MMNAPAGFPSSQETKALHLLVCFWLTTLLAVVGLALVTIVMLRVVPPNRIDDSFAARFTINEAYFYPGQPAKDMAFEVGAVLAPLFVATAYFLSRGLLRQLRPAWLPWAARGAAGLTWLIFFWSLSPILYSDHAPSAELAPGRLLLKWYWMLSPLPWWGHVMSLGLGIAAYLWFWKRDIGPRPLNGTLAVLLLCWALFVPIGFYAPTDFNDELRFTYHFNPIADALSQAANGHHLLVDFPHVYGGYVEILGPLLAMLPRRLEILLAIFPVLNAVAVLALLLTARLVIRVPFLLLATGAALLALFGITTSYDHYYANTPIRLFFPALGLLASAWHFRQPKLYSYQIVSVLASVATVWNLESGLALWLGWATTLLVVGLSNRNWKQGAWDFAAQFVYLAGAWMAFLLYLRLVSGSWPDVAMVFVFPKLFAGSGYMCLPMRCPDAWIGSVVIYMAALAVTGILYIQKRASWRTHFALVLTLFGIGIFHYFVGRSAPSNLIAVSYPMLLLIGMVLSEARFMIAQGSLPAITGAVILPCTIILGWWALLLPAALPSLLLQSAGTLTKLRSIPPTPLQTNAAFIARFTSPGEGIGLLSNQSGVDYYLSGTVRPIRIPGAEELFLTRDMDTLIAAIAGERFPKLFVDDHFFVINLYRPEICARIRHEIAQHYQPQAYSATGQVTLYLPR